jgi:hypothetical protein
MDSHSDDEGGWANSLDVPGLKSKDMPDADDGSKTPVQPVRATANVEKDKEVRSEPQQPQATSTHEERPQEPITHNTNGSSSHVDAGEDEDEDELYVPGSFHQRKTMSGIKHSYPEVRSHEGSHSNHESFIHGFMSKLRVR